MTDFRLQDPRHEAVRQELLRRYRTASYNCGTFTRAMAERFPDLKRVPGFYYAPDSDASHGEHWWLEDAQGAIVDPTADQFPSQGRGRYVRYSPRIHKLLKGKCMGCGRSLYTREGTYPCSKGCDEELAAEYGTRLAGGPYEDDMEFSCDADITERYGIVFTAVVS
jgi:hypothetical protein